jgi:hypothetical protein
VAAMPSFGLKQKLGVAVLAATMFALSASAASANEAWVWACHGPNGGSIATPMDPASSTGASASVNCGDDGPGASLRLTAGEPVAGTRADVRITLPTGVTTKKLVIYRNAGAGGAGVHYRVSQINTNGDTPPREVEQQILDRPLAGLPAAPDEIPFTGSGTLRVSLICTQEPTCAAPAAIDIVKVGVLVDDSSAPSGGVNRSSPVNSVTEFTASPTEYGVGFSHVVAMIATSASDAAVIRSKSLTIGECADLSPGVGTIDLPLDPKSCVTGRGTASFLADKKDDGTVISVKDALDSSALPEGNYFRRVVVYDAAGNAADLIGSVWEQFEVWHPVLGSPTAELSIGSSPNPDQPQTNPNQNPNTQPGNTAGTCRSPRLSVSLGQKPLRVSKSVVVLQYGKRYRFEGRLTCVVNGRRISAPKRTKVELLNKVGKKTVAKSGPRIATKGRFKISLKYPKGSRTLIFRFTNADKQRSQVSIKIKVEKKKKASSKR